MLQGKPGVLQRKRQVPQRLTNIVAWRPRCCRSTWPVASSGVFSSPATLRACPLDADTSALAAAALLHASAFSAIVVASISIASARAALAAAVADAEAPSAAESEAACRQSRLHPRNMRTLSLSRPMRAISTTKERTGEFGVAERTRSMSVYARQEIVRCGIVHVLSLSKFPTRWRCCSGSRHCSRGTAQHCYASPASSHGALAVADQPG